MFVKRSVMRRAFRAVGELGLTWDGVGHLGKDALRLYAAVQAAARRAARQQWEIEAGKLPS